MIDRISPLQNGGFSTKTSAAKAEQTSFGEELLQRQSQPVAFSKHARERAEQRGISVDEQLMDRLSDTVEKAQAKGANNILAFDTTRAFIINVPNGRVITAMSPEEMKENIFTNIDGAVIL
ncbi:TIGR02530 family flagellar biosynthesis protein [Oscillibacter sp.]|uniref:TIGR02530 family flagellar biosynthesis protein n=1 Tax=Oscillibacter sp. TaxID=1945593 RepID=UPI00289B07AF|nr:TIGR02530 family flagellar biosynthesis protein [Oscillibacter sp.]